MTNDFNEDEWRASAKGSPSFHFEKGESKGKPDFEPDPTPEEEADAQAREWRAAEPPPSHRNQAHNPGYGGGEFPNSDVDDESRKLAMVCHGIGALFMYATMNTLGWVVPLCVWLMRKDESDFVASQAKEALNFQITMALASVVAGVLWVTFIGIPFAILLVGTCWVATLVWSIQGAMTTYRGERYTYPISFRIL